MMKRGLKRTIKKVVEFGLFAHEIDDRIHRPISEAVPPVKGKGIVIPSIRVVYGVLGIDKETNATWATLKDTMEYKTIKRKIVETKGLKVGPNLLEEYLREFVFEITSTLPRQKRRNKPKWLRHEITLMAISLIEGLGRKPSDFGVVVPLYNLRMDVFEVDLSGIGRIRRAYYSEKRDFTVQFPEGIFAYRPDRFDYVLEFQNLNVQEIIQQLQGHDRYVSYAGNLVLALRLHLGGGVGIEFVHVWVMFGDKQHFLGTVLPMGATTIQAPRGLRPCGSPTYVDETRSKQLLKVLKTLETLDFESFYVRALRRYGTAQETHNPDDKIIDCMIALECLFGLGKEGIRMADAFLASVFGTVLKTVGKEQGLVLHWESLLNDCWNARSRLVHGSSISSANEAARGNLKTKARNLLLFLRFCLLGVILIGCPDRTKLHSIIDDFRASSKVCEFKPSIKTKAPVSMEIFESLDLKVGKVLNCKRVSGTSKLLSLEVDVGSGTILTVAALADEYTPKELLGLSGVFLVNLEPRIFYDIESTGMILVVENADKADKHIPIAVSDVPIGSKVV